MIFFKERKRRMEAARGLVAQKPPEIARLFQAATKAGLRPISGDDLPKLVKKCSGNFREKFTQNCARFFRDKLPKRIRQLQKEGAPQSEIAEARRSMRVFQQPLLKAAAKKIRRKQASV